MEEPGLKLRRMQGPLQIHAPILTTQVKLWYKDQLLGQDIPLSLSPGSSI